MKRFMTFILFAFIISCSQQDKNEIEQSASAFDLSQAKAAVQQSNLALEKSFKAGDTLTIIKAYTKDAKLLPAGRKAIEGKDSIAKFFSFLHQSDVHKIDIKTTNVWGDSSLLAEEGRYIYTGSGDTTIDKGKYIVLWKRESGNWKMYRDMWTSDLIGFADLNKKPSSQTDKKKKKKKK